MSEDYSKYLRSEEWSKIRRKVLKRDNYKCAKCEKTNNLNVHHETYAHIFKESDFLGDLITLCGDCHVKAHNEGCEKFALPRIFASKQRMFRKVMYDRQPDLRHADLGKWHLLIKYLEQNTNRLVVPDRDEATGWLDHRALTFKDLMEILNISERSLRSFLTECKSKGYIRQSAHGDSYMFPLYVMNGGWMEVELYLIFRDVQELNDSLTDSEKTIISAYLGIDEEVNDTDEEAAEVVRDAKGL